ncbi:AAEL011075-PA [Aedes aegypti]|uniref:AAEL011075-PA n=1 Tax=Aedes aegypti TaxID=7159 RepID=Q16R49_AEDAE|nr:AAEL011075-PA [Aedes aegypti]
MSFRRGKMIKSCTKSECFKSVASAKGKYHRDLPAELKDPERDGRSAGQRRFLFHTSECRRGSTEEDANF